MNPSMFKPSEEIVHIFDDAARPGIGKCVRTYVIHQHVGTGGMGEVYRVSRSHRGDQVALKIIPFFSRLPKSDRERIEFEQAALETLTQQIKGQSKELQGVFSSNIVLFHEVGRIPERDLYYIAMEFVDGTSLREWMPKIHRKGHPNIDLIHQVLTALLRGLHLVHNQNIVHRDLKPSNILVPLESGKPRFDQLKLTDFGISFNLAKDERYTIQGMTIGTPDYMSPEQCKGEVVGPAADIYSVGVMLYEMLTGAPPFSSDKAIETMQNHVKGEIVPPSQKLGFSSANSPIPRRLEMLCMKCLQKDPKMRFRSASDLMHELAGFYREHQSQVPASLQSRIRVYGEMMRPWVFSRYSALAAVLLALVFCIYGLVRYMGAHSGPSAETFLKPTILGLDNSVVEELSPQEPYVVDVDQGVLNERQPLMSFELENTTMIDRIAVGLQSHEMKSGASMAVADTLFLEDDHGNQRVLQPKFDRGIQFISLDNPLIGKHFKLYFKTKEKRPYHKIAVVRFYVLGLETPKELDNEP